MGMVKRLIEEYCEAMHPDNFDTQDELFEAICDGTEQPSFEEMQSVIAVHEKTIEQT